jgi:membrane protease YdiL (CAAX protease family)
LAGWIRRHPVIAVIALVFLFEWIIMVPQVAEVRGLLPFHVPAILGLAAGWGPALAAVIVTGVVSGRVGIKGLFSRYLIWKVGAGWYAIAAFITAAFILGGLLLNRLLGGKTPELPIQGVSPAVAAFAFVVTVVFGFLVNTEDVAWRGVALPRLQAAHGALSASLIIGLFEGLTHLPYFFIPGDFRQQVGLWFMVFTVAMVIIMTWMYNNTRGSLLIVVLCHAAQNAWANLLDTTPAPGPNDLRPFILAVALMVAVAVALIAIYGPARLSRRPAAELPQPD